LSLQPTDRRRAHLPPSLSHDELKESKPSPQVPPNSSSSLRLHSTAETKAGKSYTRRQVEELIQEAVRAAKEIDQKTIQEMILEMNNLTSQLQLQERQLQQLRDTTATSTSHLPPSNPPSNAINKQKANASKASSSIQIVYAFLFGSFVMLFVSALLPWAAHLLWNLRLSDGDESREEEEE
jgi:biotin carboxyl carrier protein